jgi:histidinol-phosphatase
MGYRKEYGELLETIAKEADAIAMRYFRAAEMRVERKSDGSAVTQADREVEEMARAKVAASGIALDVLGEEMGDTRSGGSVGRTRLIIDPIDGTDEFSRGIPTFGTLLGIEREGEIVAGMASAGIAIAVVGVSRRRRLSQREAAAGFKHRAAE